ncbi:hypothetical protein GS610_05430 [Ruegeria sp. HKCCD6228]|uniref:hypothetical protein n=1 Tax=Ruegeria sp. HKCCD6228 TaxID=2683001 RepID=UPI00149193F1|nr:hypothetical protein [Ruegeria sp. HKCCD6228]NOD96646.1 hypothetical protein [Ruegeria sp. HKCCD6228]
MTKWQVVVRKDAPDLSESEMESFAAKVGADNVRFLAAPSGFDFLEVFPILRAQRDGVQWAWHGEEAKQKMATTKEFAN